MREPTYADLSAAVRVHCDPRTNAFNPNGPPAPETVESMLCGWIEHWKSYRFGYWAIELKEAQGIVIGFGGIMRKRVEHLFGLNMYFRFVPEAWGKGHASQVARAGLKLAFGALGAQEVLASVRANNLPSRRTLERVGFVESGESQNMPGQVSSLIYRAVTQHVA